MSKKPRDEDEAEDDLDEVPEDGDEDVEVERMPDLGGWEYFRAVDRGAERDRWIVGVRHAHRARDVEYAFWKDLKKDPAATGLLLSEVERKERWAKAVRDATKEDGHLDDRAREEILLAILERHDGELSDYEERLLFTLAPPDDEDDDDDDEDDEDD